MPNNSPNKDHSKNEPSNAAEQIRQESSSQNNRLRTLCMQVRQRILPLIHRPGVYTRNHLLAAGFRYTGDGDATQCEDCGLEVSGWTVDMDPFTIHSTRRPDCPFVCSITHSLSVTAVSNTPVSNEQQNTSERQSIESVDSNSSSNSFIESNLLQQVRRRGFSHWPHRTIPSSTQMIEAGFFNCNVGDRVMCIYCNLICQQWTSHVDDPCEVHRTLSPECIYARALLTRRRPPFIINNNQRLMTITVDRPSFASNNINSLPISERVRPVDQNNNSGPIRNNLSSSSTSPSNKLPSIDDTMQANYFNTDVKTNVTCVYCDGSLRNLDSNENPMIDHARRFPDCPYVQQLYGTQMYRQIQESNRAQQKRAGMRGARENTRPGDRPNTNRFTDTGQLLIPNESILHRLVAARLNLPMSRILLQRNYALSIIKRCWEDQLRLKRENFVSDLDLKVACLVLQRQVEHIAGKKENITIPSEAMRQLRERNLKEQKEVLAHIWAARESTSHNAIRSSGANASNGNVLGMRTSSQSCVDSTSESTTTGAQGETTTTKQTPSTTQDEEQSTNGTPSSPCVLCLTEEKRLACIPCGHLATCVPCGHSLRSCPICRTAIEAFVRVNI